MSYYNYQTPPTWTGFRDIDEKIDFSALEGQLENGEILGTGNFEEEALGNSPPAGTKKEGAK